jgi:hypothetical protein
MDELIMGFKEYLNPDCAICNKEVDKCEWVMDWRTNEVFVTAFCHGDKETCCVDSNIALHHKVEKGIAFMNKRIEDPNKHAFDPQIKKQVSWIDEHLEAKGKMFNQEQEMFYRATDYRGS